MTIHKGNCSKKANTTTHCSQRLISGSVVENMKLNRKKAALDSLQEIIAKEVNLRPHRVDAFLTLVTRIPGYPENSTYYECFSGKIVAEINSEDPLGSNLRFSVDAEVLDAFAVVILWLQNSCSFEEKIAPLKILYEISKAEENKSPILSLGHTDALTEYFVPINSRPTDEITLDEAKCTHLIFTILRNIYNTKERLLLLIDNNQLERIIFFLKILKRVEAENLGIYKEKNNRIVLRASRDQGYKFLESYIINFYDKDNRVTDYLCSRQTLDLIMDAGSRSIINLANEINPSDIKVKKKKPIYESQLCIVNEARWKRLSVAVKKLLPESLSYKRANFLKEITMFSLIKHPNACPFYGAFIPPEEDDTPVQDIAGGPLILMTLFKNGSLADYLNKRRAELEKQNLFGKRQVIETSTLINMAMNAANCIQFLHSRTIIHRDIKPANFLLDDNWVIRVTDFGVSRAMYDISTGTYTYTGTEVWMAPEVFNKYYDQKVDTYSFGLVLWSMLTGLLPYDNYKTLSAFTDEIIVAGTRETIPEFNPPVHPELSRLICKCWAADPVERPEFTEILERLYNMKCLITQRPYTHIYDGLEEKEFHQFVELLLGYMDYRTRTSFCLTNTKFYPFRKRSLCM